MGTWGIGVFDDDVASDVKDQYLSFLEEGYVGSKATKEVVAQFAEVIEDSDDGCVFWIALAAVQSEVGRLERTVKQRALKIIAEGKDLKRWENDSKAIKLRRSVLTELAKRLKGRQPKRRRMDQAASRIPPFTHLQIGQIFAYRLRSGKWTLIRMTNITRDLGGEYPNLQLMDWVGSKPPSSEKAATVSDKIHDEVDPIEGVRMPVRITILGGDYPEDRIVVVGKGKPDPQGGNSSVALDWDRLEGELRDFGLR